MSLGAAKKKPEVTARIQEKEAPEERKVVLEAGGTADALTTQLVVEDVRPDLVIPMQKAGKWSKGKIAELLGDAPPPLEGEPAAEGEKEKGKEGAAATDRTAPMTDDAAAAAALLEDAKKGDEEEEVDAPILLQNMVPGILSIKDDLERFKHDVESRPEDMDVHKDSDRYERVPVEAFGHAMLRGMGWKPGDAIGLTNAAVVEPIEFLPRAERLGLGANVVKPKDRPDRKYIKPGQSRDEKAIQQVVVEADGRIRHHRKLSKRIIQVHALRLREGALVEITHGPHARLYGRVAKLGDRRRVRKSVLASGRSSVPGGSSVEGFGSSAAQLGDDEEEEVQMCDIRLNLSEQLVTIPQPHFTIMDENALPRDHPAFITAANASKMKKSSSSLSSTSASSSSSSKSRGKENRKGKKRSRSVSSSSSDSDSDSDGSSRKRAKKDKKDRKRREKEKEREKRKAKEESRRAKDVITWVVPSIRVRIISKSLADGRYYQAKGKVLDVVDRHTFTMQMDNGKLLEGVRQSQVESALPKAGGRVRVLGGEHKGQTGLLLERNSERAQAVVQLDQDMDTAILSFDDLAELAA